jgi:DNA polymerase III subunit beta
MELTIERGALLRSLGHVQSVVERRNTIPILSNVLIEAVDGAVNFTATDLDLAIIDTVSAEVAQGGATTVPAHTLHDIVRKLPDGAQVSIALDADGSKVKLAAGRSKFTLACLPRDDFPVMSEGDLPYRFDLGAADLKRLVDKTRFAISTEETRYYLNGIYLHGAETDGVQMLRAVATDGHRLARVELPLPEGAAGMPGIIIPRKTVSELRKLIEENEETITVALSDSKIRFAFRNAVVTSKLIDGTFPDYGRVIPSDNDKTMEVDTKQLSQAVDRVSTISTDKSRAIKLELDTDRLTLSATSPENGTATEELGVSYSESELSIGFNSRYVLDIADEIEGDIARFQFADAAAPTLVLDSADDGALYVLMPMRV